MLRSSLIRLAAATVIATVIVYSISCAEGEKRATTPSQPAAADSSKSPAAPAPGAIEQTAVEKALDKQVSVTLKDKSFKDVAAYLADLSGVNVLLDTKGLTDSGILENRKITFEIKDVRLGAAIHELLAQYDLGYAILQDNVLLITSAAAASEHVIARVYNVDDLLPPPAPAGEFMDYPPHDDDASSVVDMISSSGLPAHWAASGGSGSISAVRGRLVVSQTPDAHRDIAALLAALRAIRAGERAGTAPTVVLVGSSPAEDKIRQRLERRQDVDFHEMPLTGVCDYLRAQGVPVYVDQRHLTDAGITLDTPLSFQAKQVPLKFALRRMFAERDMNYFLRDGLLVITSDSAAKEHVRLGIYPVADLVGAEAGAGPDDLDYDSVINMITSVIAPTSWTDGSGPPPVSPFLNPVALAVSQTEENHDLIADVLSQLRAARRMPRDPTAAKPPVIPKDKMVVWVHHLANKDDAVVDEYIAAIRNLVEPKSWGEGRGYIGKAPGVIVVRNSLAAQKQIHTLLDQIDGAMGSGFGSRSGGFGGRQGSSKTPAPTTKSPPVSNPSGTPPPIVDPASPKASASSKPKPPAALKPK